MFETILEHRFLTGMMILLLLLSIICKIVTGVLLQSLIRETENMSATDNRLLKQFKHKFASCYRLNDGAVNVPIFTDKFIQKMKIGPFRLETLSQISGQFLLLSVFAAGSAACISLAQGAGLYDVLPFYFMAAGGLYVYFAVSGFVNFNGRKKILKTNLIDFLENRFAGRVEEAADFERRFPDEKDSGKQEAGKTAKKPGEYPQETRSLAEAAETEAESVPEIPDYKIAGGDYPVETRTEENLYNTAQEKELEALLREFLA